MSETPLKRMIYNHSPVPIQNLITTIYGWQKGRYRYGRKSARQWYEFYLETAEWPEEKLREYQWEQVKYILDYAYRNVPYYKRRFDEAGVVPDRIKAVSDMKLLPLLSKDDIRKAGKDLISMEYDPRKLFASPTSGSTGMPLILYSDRVAAERNFNFRWAQCRPGLERNKQRYINFTGLEIVDADREKPPFWRMNYADNQRVYSVFHMSDRYLPYYLEDIELFSPEWVYGYPSALYVISDFVLRTGYRFKIKPKAAIVSSEQCLPEYKEVIEKAFGCPLLDEYGQGEMAGLAFTCRCGKLHEKIDYSLMEFVPVGEEDGYQVCELICTSFINKAWPLIRYHVGDLALIDPNASCPYGRPGRVIEQIYGRTAQYVIAGDGSKITNISVIAKKCRNLKAMQAVQEKAGEVILRIIPQPEYNRLEDEPIIFKEFRKKFGSESKMHIEIQYVDNIELTKSGKYLSIVNKLKPDQR